MENYSIYKQYNQLYKRPIIGCVDHELESPITVNILNVGGNLKWNHTFSINITVLDLKRRLEKISGIKPFYITLYNKNGIIIYNQLLISNIAKIEGNNTIVLIEISSLNETFIKKTLIEGFNPLTLTRTGNIFSNLCLSWKLNSNIVETDSELCRWKGVILNHDGSLELFFNHQRLKGHIPESICELTNIYRLMLNYNELIGYIPYNIGELNNLKFLELHNNQLIGSIPDSIGNLNNIMELNLSNNQLSGPIPDSICDLTIIQELRLFNNQLSGHIPDSIENLTNLTILKLNNNELTGPIPDSICNLTKLEVFFLNNNKLSGTIPDSIGNLTKMQELNLSNNQLSGIIPKSIGDLVNMFSLELNNNQFTDIL